MKLSVSYSASLVLVLVCINVVFAEPPVRNSGGSGWGNQQQQQQQQYSPPAAGYGPPGGNYNSGGQNGGGGQPQVQSGGWGAQQAQTQQANNAGGWGQQAQTQQANNAGGWGQQAQTQQAKNAGGWSSGNAQPQKQADQGNSGWGPQINFELDSANIKKFNPADFFRSIIGIPRRIINFIRESGLYILLIPLIIILPLMLLAFNAGRLLGGLGGWGWSKRSLSSTVESGIVGYLKSPAWQKVAETLMDEHVFDRVMKSLEEFMPKTKKQNCSNAPLDSSSNMIH